MIREMLYNGVSFDIIYKCAGLPRTDVDAIIAKIRKES